jgi:hypothetical protein
VVVWVTYLVCCRCSSFISATRCSLAPLIVHRCPLLLVLVVMSYVVVVVNGDGGGGVGTCLGAVVAARVVVVVVVDGGERVEGCGLRLWQFISHTGCGHNIFPK